MVMTRPGELVHVDIKKLGRIPKGGGWRAHGRGKVKRAKVGYALRALRGRWLHPHRVQRGPCERTRSHRSRFWLRAAAFTRRSGS